MEDLQIVEKIGQGSYSTVYKTFKKGGNTKEYVAIKVVDFTKLSNRGREDILTEIQMLKILKHKNIVEMLDFKWDNRSIFIIMEYCDGGDLSSFIKKRHKLPERTCQKFLQQLAVGLQFLRSHNISHLDLKPQNLLIVTKPKITLKIGDFGFAQFVSSTAQKMSTRGSPLYMAPEMLLGGKYDAKADLWSVGVIAYECLFGRAPYSSNSYKELYNKIKSKAPIELSHDVTLSANCRNFLTSLLIHEPELRMNYDAFFNHPFLELDLIPSETTLKKALRLFQEAEHLDATNQHVEAFNKYCEGLKFMFPIFEEETVEEKKLSIRAKLTHYTKRAEELKCMLTIDSSSREEVAEFSRCDKSSERTTNASLQPDHSEVDGITNNEPIPSKLTPRCDELKQLISLCSKTPILATAMEIGVNAQMYLAEGKYELAFEKFQKSLGILLPLLPAESPGVRRELLRKQVEAWMHQAESAKSLLSMTKTDESQTAAKGNLKKSRNIVLSKFLKGKFKANK